MLLIQILILVICANGSPVLAQHWFQSSFISKPVDMGFLFLDGKPLFGHSKTWRGLVASLILTPICALFIGLPALHGFMIAILAMCGDLLSSFIKRRLNRPVSGMALGLDQIPESLLPFLFAAFYYPLGVTQIITGVMLFIIFELLLSVLLFRLGIRKKPY